MQLLAQLYIYVTYLLSTIMGLWHTGHGGRAAQPNVIVIIGDDMGWDDVGFHGSNEIPTPNIDALAYSGVILNRHYALPTCTPSRAAFLTGRYPIRMGLQGLPINMAEPRGVPLREKLLPECLKKLGYVTRLVGKWHLGYYTDDHVPTSRGFDSFAGYYGGYIRYFDHTSTKQKHTGIDMHMDVQGQITPYNEVKYFTDYISEQAENIIKGHDKAKPLYLQVAHLAGHASENVDPIEVRNMTEVNNTLGYIPDVNRRRYAGIIAAMDESVGRVVNALSEANMLENSIILFTSDNGAPTAVAPFINYGSNYPFRGIKSTLYEGGVRVPAFVFSPLIKTPSRVSEEFIHITDWFPTVYRLAGGDPDSIDNIDGVDQWATISDSQKSKRNAMLLNIDEVLEPEAAIMGNYKLIKKGEFFGTEYVDRSVYSGSFIDTRFTDFYGKNGNYYSPKIYNVTKLLSSLSGKAVLNLPNIVVPKERKMRLLRKKATVNCHTKEEFSNCTTRCLFDLINDPCEMTDISENFPEIVHSISKYISSFYAGLMNQTNTYIDPAGYPDNFDGYWMPWLKNEYTPPKDKNLSIIYSPAVFCEGFPVDDPRNCL